MPKFGDPVPLDQPQRQAMGAELADIIEEGERNHARLFRDLSVWWEWYNAVPDVPYRSEPWPGASNLVVPIVSMQADAHVARTLLQLFGTGKLWVGSTENTTWQDLVPSIFEFLNYGARKGMGADLFEHTEPAIAEQEVIGESFFTQVWDARERWIVPPNGDKPVMVSTGAGPTVRHIPRERIIFNRDVPVHDSDYVALQHPFTWGQLVREFRRNGWDLDLLSDIEDQSGLSGLTGKLRLERMERMGIQERSGGKFEPHDVRQVWVDFPFLRLMSPKLQRVPGVQFHSTGDDGPDDVTVPLLCTMHQKTRTLIHAIYAPYLLDRYPIYQLTRKRGGTREESGRGLAKDLEHLQRGITTIINQSIDAATFSHSLKAFTSDRNLEGTVWTPNKIPYVRDLNAIKEIRTQNPISADVAIINLLQAMVERVGGTPDPALGREIRQGGHPQPATNFLGLLQQSQMTSSRSIKSVRNAFSKMGEHRAVLYQQFEKNRGGWIARTFDDKDAANIMQWLDSPEPLIGQIQFDVHALSEIHNPQEEQRKAITINQMVTNHYVAVTKFLEAAHNPQTPPPVKAALQKGVEAMSRSMINFLEASDIDDVEQYVERFQRSQNDGVQLLESLGQFIQQGGAGGGAGPAGAAGPEGADDAGVGGVVDLPARAAGLAGGNPGGGGSAFTG